MTDTAMLSPSPTTPVAEPACVLLVDDEPNVLSALTRALRGEHYHLLTATDGDQALALMDEHSVDVVISDSKMPGMDGVALLSRIQAAYPRCLRLLLTGHHDLSAVIQAINEGHIYHYIAKPWRDDDLRLSLRQAVALQQSERERERLEAVTQAQNDALKRFNADLEARVAARTAELKQLADWLDAANQALEHSYETATRVFSSLLYQRLPPAHQTHHQIGNVLRAFLDHHPVEERLRRDVLMAASLYNLGKLSWDDHLLGLSSEKMFGDDRVRYLAYPTSVEDLLMALEPLQGAAKLIRHHQERWNGSGFPGHLHDEAIPWGARLLRLAIDFIELQHGLMLDREVSRNNALMLLKKLAGRVYDPELSQVFVAFCTDHAPDMGMADASVMALGTDKLQAGMRLVRDLYSGAGHLLLNEGRELTQGLIDKLIRFETAEDERYTVLVREPGQEDKVDEAPIEST